jgi:hypothetical protein
VSRLFNALIAVVAVVAPLAAAPRRPTLAADYTVTARAGASELRVEAAFAAPGGTVAVEEGLGPFLGEVEVDAGDGWRAAEPRGDAILVPSCAARPCRLRYTVRLADAALALRDRARALEHAGALLAPPSSWLVRPLEPRAGERYRFRVRTSDGLGFVTGVSPSPSGDGYEAALEDLAWAPYSGFGTFDIARVRAGGSTVELAIGPGQRSLTRAAIVEWAERAAAAVTRVYGRLPVPRVAVLVLPGGRRPVGFGTTMGHGGASIMVWLGAQATDEDLRRDWVLTHEMTHLGLPNLPRAQRWLEEGLATYLEPVARARAGQVTAEETWAGFVTGLPKGLPRPGDGGLDGTRSWGRTYWGGALFFLLADIGIRERTANRHSLDDALRGIVAEGGTIAVRWSLERVLASGDRAAGVDVLQKLHARLGSSPENVDLQGLWSRLGVRATDGAVTFDDRAPLAAIRRSLTASSATAVEPRVRQLERLLQAGLQPREVGAAGGDVLLRASVRVDGQRRGHLDQELARPGPRDLQPVGGEGHPVLDHASLADDLEEHAQDPAGRTPAQPVDVVEHRHVRIVEQPVRDHPLVRDLEPRRGQGVVVGVGAR